MTNIIEKPLLTINQCFRPSKSCDNCFLKGCKWSPDGLCLLTASEDYQIRLFEIPNLHETKEENDVKPTLEYGTGGIVYDYAWYPQMNSADPSTCVFASASTNSPISLWDAYTGGLRATYQPINQYDEVHHAMSLAFSPSGKLYAGFMKTLKIFDLMLPGREFQSRSFKDNYQQGIISCIAFNPVISDLYALGSYDRSIGLYTEKEGQLQCVLQAHRGGVTHLKFSSDGGKLYSGGRKDNELLCWDLRKPGTLLFTIQRTVSTSQRIYFDLTSDDKYLITGSTTGQVSVYDTTLPPLETGYLPPILSWQAHQDCANGVSIHPGGRHLATASGQRHSYDPWSDDDDDTSDQEVIVENSLKIWDVPLVSLITTEEPPSSIVNDD